MTPVPAQGLVIGRDQSCDYTIPAQQFPGVSGRHVRIAPQGDGLEVEDLDSKNGTLVAGERVEHATLAHGDSLQLGRGGPKFLAVAPDRMSETLSFPTSTLAAPLDETIGTRTIRSMRRSLGLDPDEVVRRSTRRSLVIAVGVLAVVGVTLWALRDRGLAAFEQQRVALQAQSEQLADARAAWEAEQSSLEQDRQALTASIAQLEADDDATGDELARLRQELAAANETLQLYDPVNVEQARLVEVARVEQAVVLIEVRQRFREKVTGQVLYNRADPDDPRVSTMNFRAEGTPFELESSGSGFCCSADGWIVTNAHVVLKKEPTRAIDLGPSIDLEPQIDIAVVFSGESRRHPARLVSWDAEGDADLAVIKIEPFEGMPHTAAPPIERPAPPRGTEVFLVGFPLGKRAMQLGDTMIASTFRGIVSRRVGSYLQVDAAVHPGASGGPVIDGAGNLVGVVTGMQIIDADSASSAIGYVIPVKALDVLWPPE